MRIGKTKISFVVDGKPPRKSQWGKEDAELIIKLREAGLKARNDAGIGESHSGPVKLNLTIYAPNITNRNYIQTGNDDPKKFVGDLDNFVSGVCDYLHKGPIDGENNHTINSLFNDKPEIGPKVSLIIDDDSQIIEINAKKETGDKIYYHVEVIFIKWRSNYDVLLEWYMQVSFFTVFISKG